MSNKRSSTGLVTEGVDVIGEPVAEFYTTAESNKVLQDMRAKEGILQELRIF